MTESAQQPEGSPAERFVLARNLAMRAPSFVTSFHHPSHHRGGSHCQQVCENPLTAFLVQLEYLALGAIDCCNHLLKELQERNPVGLGLLVAHQQFQLGDKHIKWETLLLIIEYVYDRAGDHNWLLSEQQVDQGDSGIVG